MRDTIIISVAWITGRISDGAFGIDMRHRCSWVRAYVVPSLVEFTIEVRTGTEVPFNQLPTLSGVTNNSPSLFTPSECGRDRGRDAVEVKSHQGSQYDKGKHSRKLLSWFDVQQKGARGTGDIRNPLDCMSMHLR